MKVNVQCLSLHPAGITAERGKLPLISFMEALAAMMTPVSLHLDFFHPTKIAQLPGVGAIFLDGG